MKINSQAASTIKHARPKWHLIYYVLAAFDLFAVSLGLYLNQRISDAFNQSVEESAVWAERKQNILHLSDLAIQANEPGNRIFETNDFDREKQQLTTALSEYQKLSKSIETELKENIAEQTSRKIIEHLYSAQTSLQNMALQTEQIFLHLQNKELVMAGQNMSVMDSQYYEVNKSLSEANRIAAQLQSDFFAKTRQQIKSTEDWRFIIASFIVIMVIAVTLYGQMLARKIRRDELHREMLEEHMQQTILRVNTILNTTADAIITINTYGLIESFNKAAEDMFGYSADEVMGRNIKILMPSPYSEEHDSYLERYKLHKDSRIIDVEREGVAKRKDGSTFPTSIKVGEVNFSNNTHFIGTIRDITEQKKIERLKNEFISTVSHELRTPLTAINGVISILHNEVTGKQTPESKDLLERGLLNSEKLQQIINDILDIQKIESGTYDYNIGKINVTTLLETAFKENQPYADRLNIKLKLDQPEINTEFDGDTGRLLQVMANLISNACKFSPENSTVALSAYQEAKHICFVITDNGPGIPEEYKEKIFRKFIQVDGSDSRAKGGTGLGLNIARSIIDYHHGKIWFEDNPEGGTCFKFNIPLTAKR